MTSDHAQRQRGSALILVLWISLLLSLILVGIITISRSELRTTRVRQEIFQAKNAARTALETAAFEISTRRDQNNAFTNMSLEIDNYRVEVEKSDEAKKLDLNFASEAELTRFFRFLGEEPETAQNIAANIADWRDRDDIARPNGAETRDYVRARDQRRPKNRAFQSISELENVLDITEELTACALPGLTVFGEVNGPDAAFLGKLYKKNYPKERSRQSTTSLGTAARITNAGGRYSLVAKVTSPSEQEKIITKTLGVFRVSGNQQKPYEWIAIMESENRIQPPNCEAK